jgi:hypothetical protein
MNTDLKAWWQPLLWLVAAACLGFAVPALFSGVMGLPRRLYLLPYMLIVGAFLYAYLRWSGIDLAAVLRRNWIWGVVGAVLAGAFMVMNVRSQPASPTSSGLWLIFDLIWLGLIYGALDALLLSALPVAASWQMVQRLGWDGAWGGRALFAAVALIASIVITASYHLGYVEFRNPTVTAPVFGNSVGTIAQLATGNPIASLGSHIAMHTAAVLHGPDTVVQLPPHVW